MSSRRDFLAALGLGAGLIAVPGFGRWHRQGSGILVPDPIDYNKWPVGLVDITTTRSVHGLSGATYTHWTMRVPAGWPC